MQPRYRLRCHVYQLHRCSCFRAMMVPLEVRLGCQNQRQQAVVPVRKEEKANPINRSQYLHLGKLAMKNTHLIIADGNIGDSFTAGLFFPEFITSAVLYLSHHTFG